MAGKGKSPPSGWEKVQLVSQIYGCIPPWVDWQRNQRTSSDLPPQVRSGINFSIILCAACFLEGFFERHLVGALDKSVKPTNPLHQRLLEDSRKRARATMGSENYDQMFELVFGKKASALCDQETWEAIRILFHFRNMLAHGRAIEYTTYWPPGAGGIWQEEFDGNYAKVQTFLLKKGLIEEEHIRQDDNWYYFQDPVADYFWDAVVRYTSGVESAIVTADWTA